MRVVANASPLIGLGRAGQLELSPRLFGRIHIAGEVHSEVVVAGAGRVAADILHAATRIQVHPPAPAPELAGLRQQHPLGRGELASVLLARKLTADLVLMDDRAARRLARRQQLNVLGTVGVLEAACRRGWVADLRDLYRRLLATGFYVERRILNASLNSLGLEGI